MYSSTKAFYTMGLQVLLRSGIYILFIGAVAAGWMLKRRQPTSRIQSQDSDSGSGWFTESNLGHPDWKVRKLAVQSIAEQHDRGKLPQLISMLDDPDHDVREAAVQAVAAFGEEAVGLVSTVLAEGALHSREAAARTLGFIRHSASVPALSSALTDNSMWVRKEAALALGEIGGSPAVSSLIQQFQSENDKDVQEAIRQALRQIGTSEALAALRSQTDRTS